MPLQCVILSSRQISARAYSKQWAEVVWHAGAGLQRIHSAERAQGLVQSGTLPTLTQLLEQYLHCRSRLQVRHRLSGRQDSMHVDLCSDALSMPGAWGLVRHLQPRQLPCRWYLERVQQAVDKARSECKHKQVSLCFRADQCSMLCTKMRDLSCHQHAQYLLFLQSFTNTCQGS